MVMGEKTETSAMDVIAKLLEQNNALLRENSTLRLNLNGNGNGGNGTVKTARVHYAAKRVLDTKTNIAYRAEYLAGIEVAKELGIPVHSRVWYELIGTGKKPGPAAGRFAPMTEEAYQAHPHKFGEKPATTMVAPTTPATTIPAVTPPTAAVTTPPPANTGKDSITITEAMKEADAKTRGTQNTPHNQNQGQRK